MGKLGYLVVSNKRDKNDHLLERKLILAKIQFPAIGRLYLTSFETLL